MQTDFTNNLRWDGLQAQIPLSVWCSMVGVCVGSRRSAGQSPERLSGCVLHGRAEVWAGEMCWRNGAPSSQRLHRLGRRIMEGF